LRGVSTVVLSRGRWTSSDPVGVSGKAILDLKISPEYPTQRIQPLLERDDRNSSFWIVFAQCHQHADPQNCGSAIQLMLSKYARNWNITCWLLASGAVILELGFQRFNTACGMNPRRSLVSVRHSGGTRVGALLERPPIWQKRNVTSQ
jgi:hypothetical protein